VANIPCTGPVLVACRHVHHLDDGVSLLAVFPRPLHIVVALDWATNLAGHAFMRLICTVAQWPVILRHHNARRSAFTPAQRKRYLQRASREVVALLRKNRVIVMFPEGWPNVDPSWTPKKGVDDKLAFEQGFVRLVALAERGGHPAVAIVPAGLYYPADGRRSVTLRFGEAMFTNANGRRELLQLIEQRVAELSQPPRAEPDG